MPVLWNQHDTFRPRQIDCHFQDDIFKRIFLNGRCENFIEICFTEYNRKCSSIVSENGSAPTRRQTIIWTNYMLDNWHIYVALGLSENRNLGISHQFGLLRKIHRARVCQFSASRSLNQWWHFTLGNKLQGNWIKMKCITVPKTNVIVGKFNWEVLYVIIFFLYVQIRIRLATVIYRGKKIRTVASPEVRSVNK